MSRAVIKLSTTRQWREKALHEVVSQIDRITAYFRLNSTLGHDHMPRQHWHKTGYSHEGGLQQWEQKLASLLGWYSTGDEDWLGLTQRLSVIPDPWLWAHTTHTAKFCSSPKRDGFVSATIGEPLHSSCLTHALREGHLTWPNSAWECEAIQQWEPSCWALHPCSGLV